MKVGLVVPVLCNFEGFTRLMKSVDMAVVPYVIPNYETNLGVSKAWNLGILCSMASGCDYCFVANDDVVLEPGTMQTLIANLNGDNIMTTAANTRDNVFPPPLVDEEPDFSFFCVRPREFYQTVGQFDTAFTPAYFEDNDMHYRIKLSGKKAVRVRNAPMYHQGSVTQNWGGQPRVNSSMFEKNRGYYAMKWGGVPGKEVYKVPFDNDSLTFREYNV